MDPKQKIQAEQYDFPYHHLVDLNRASFARELGFGLDYYTYMGRVLDLVRKYGRDRLLDVGCGDGFLVNQIARDPELSRRLSCTGVDLDEKAIRFAQAFSHGLPNVQFEAVDVATIPAGFSLVTLIETLEHIPDEVLPSFVSNVDRVLVSAGVVLVSVPSIVRPVLPKHFRHYDLGMIREYFPDYQLLEVHYMTARNNLLYQLIAKALSGRTPSGRRGVIENALLKAHNRFTAEVSERRGAHVVAALKKP